MLAASIYQLKPARMFPYRSRIMYRPVWYTPPALSRDRGPPVTDAKSIRKSKEASFHGIFPKRRAQVYQKGILNSFPGRPWSPSARWPDRGADQNATEMCDVLRHAMMCKVVFRR